MKWVPDRKRRRGRPRSGAGFEEIPNDKWKENRMEGNV